MKHADVTIGGTYWANVSGNRVPVEITGTHGDKGFVAVNTRTKRTLELRSAGRLTPMTPKATVGKAAKAPVEQSASEKAPVEKPAAKELVQKAAPGKEPRTPRAKPEAGPKRVSALDAAASVLAEAGEPMGCRALIETMAAKRLWTSPGGQTPHATLYSAILREITTKGDAARFVKVDRGRFTTR